MIHHRRFASGFRACELDGATTSHKENETPDVTLVTCLACQESLRVRNLLPASPTIEEAS